MTDVAVPAAADGLADGPDAIARLAAAQDAASLGTWDHDLRTGSVTWDAHCAALFGMSPADFDGTIEAFARAVHPEDRALVQAAVTASATYGYPLDVSYRALWPDGQIRHLMSRGKALTDADGAVVRILGAAVDVTELQWATIELQNAVRAQSDAARKLTALAEAALELAAAASVDELIEIVIERGVRALGADGGALAVRDDAAGVVRLSITESLGERTQVEYAELDLDNRLPAAYVARTGETVLLPTQASGLAWSPLTAAVYEASGRYAWATVPLKVNDRLLGSLVASWTDEREFDQRDLELLHAFAAQCAQALDRIQKLADERASAAATRSLSETLQRSLLTRPPQVNHLQLAVRYEAASEYARVGGDWYDALLTRDGALIVTIGDCAGHDQAAAAAMAGVRNLMRSTAYLLQDPPAAVLTALEQQMAGLEVDALATAVLARVEQPEGYRQRDLRRLTWSNAGHLPPVLRYADGTVETLTSEPDLLLGLIPGAGRSDHHIDLPDGATLLLYTDGLTERRGEDPDEGIARLADHLSELGHLPLEQLCDELLQHLQPPGGADDDIALLALRTHAEDRPRPADAGPAHTPDSTAAGTIPVEHRGVQLTERPSSAPQRASSCGDVAPWL